MIATAKRLASKVLDLIERLLETKPKYRTLNADSIFYVQKIAGPPFLRDWVFIPHPCDKTTCLSFWREHQADYIVSKLNTGWRLSEIIFNHPQ